MIIRKILLGVTIMTASPALFACNKMSFTFDDGPFPGKTERILSILKKNNAQATFFVVGRNAKAYPHLIRKIINEGHEVAVHTYNHPDLRRLSSDKARWEIVHTKDVLENITGQDVRLWRAPYGSVPGSSATQNIGMRHVLWSIDSSDWRNPGSNYIIDHVSKRYHKNAIVLFHDHSPNTWQALPTLIERAQARGYSLVSVSNLKNGACSKNPVPPVRKNTDKMDRAGDMDGTQNIQNIQNIQDVQDIDEIHDGIIYDGIYDDMHRKAEEEKRQRGLQKDRQRDNFIKVEGAEQHQNDPNQNNSRETERLYVPPDPRNKR